MTGLMTGVPTKTRGERSTEGELMTSTRTAHTSRTDRPATIRRLRRVPVPRSEPAYDDERPHAATVPAPTQGTLALQLPAPVDHVAPAPAKERHLRLVPDRRAVEGEDAFFAPQPSSSADLPDPRPWSGRYVQALVEVLAGERPVAQLMRWTSDKIYADLLRRIRTVRRGGAMERRGRERPRVSSVHVCEPRDGIAEVAIHVRHGGRSRAVAMRLEGWDGRWRCTALQLG